MTDDLQRHARSFGAVAKAYDRGRPGYGDDAATWLTGPEALTVLELGAGTGKLTRRLVDRGHDVHATEPDRAMLDLLEHNVPEVRTSLCGAEEIPAPDASYDVVVAAQCYHWFDTERALPEIARVLKRGGHLSLVWHERDERIPWVKKLGRIIGTQEQLRDPSTSVAESGLFDATEQETFSYWQIVDRRSIQDLMISRSNIAVLDEDARAQRLTELLALYDDYGRGMDGMQLPYRTSCYRSRVAGDVNPVTGPEETLPLNLVDSAATLPRGATEAPDDDAVLLIDFR